MSNDIRKIFTVSPDVKSDASKHASYLYFYGNQYIDLLENVKLLKDEIENLERSLIETKRLRGKASSILSNAKSKKETTLTELKNSARLDPTYVEKMKRLSSLEIKLDRAKLIYDCLKEKSAMIQIVSNLKGHELKAMMNDSFMKNKGNKIRLED